MPRKLLKYAPPTNRITWFTTWNYALRNYYSDDIDFVPNPTTGNDKNSHILFTSVGPNIATVDWGDGKTDQYSFYKCWDGGYRLYFRSLNVPQLKNPNSPTMGWSTPASGQSIITVPPHHYEDDDTTIERSVVVAFADPIRDIYMAGTVMTRMPIIEIPDAKNFEFRDTKYVREFSFDKLEASPNLTKLVVSKISTEIGMDARTSVVPEGILSMTGLSELDLSDVLDLRDVENSGVRRISNLKNLTVLKLHNCGIGRYLKEYNELPNLKELYCYDGLNRMKESDANEYCSMPYMGEIENINPNLTSFYHLAGWDGGNVPEADGCWFESISGKGLGNLDDFYMNLYNRMSIGTLPLYLKEMRSITRLRIQPLFKNQEFADATPETIYNYMKDNGFDTMNGIAKDGKRNQFYGVSVQGYVATNASYGSSVPSGVYQAPIDFVQGVSDGSPSTPMEYVYVLVNNYDQLWVLSSGSINRSAYLNILPVWSLLERNGRAIITDGEIKSKDSNIMKFNSFENAVEEALRQGLDISEYADNPYYDISHLLNRGGVVVDLQIVKSRKEVRYAA